MFSRLQTACLRRSSAIVCKATKGRRTVACLQPFSSLAWSNASPERPLLSCALGMKSSRPSFLSSTRFMSSSSSDDKDSSADAGKETSSSSDSSDDSSSSSSATPKETHAFQAETRQILDIVTHSLYTDKEVFLRELISNASDALEKLRHLQRTSTQVLQPDLDLEIRIELDEVTSSITISDTGIGMTKRDMIDNLGTIAKSGSKDFLEDLKRNQQPIVGDDTPGAMPPSPSSAATGIIGKFGVGFYSGFMVADRVEVRSRSAVATDPQKQYQWSSDGSGSYTLEEMDASLRQNRGTSIQLFLNEDYWYLCEESKIQSILKQYSNFVGFPIYLNGELVNTIQAVWAQDPKEVEYETYKDFYRYIATASDDPLDIVHFRVDAPLDLKVLLFIPSFHSEKFGNARLESGVSLYSRKVLIETKSDIVPDWMRFVFGVVDSEDLPLSISREKPQDTALMAKLRKVVTRKFLAHLEKMAKRDREKYLDEFYKEFSFFLKEGLCQDEEFSAQISKLLYFETNKGTVDDLYSLDEYVAKMKPEQKEIYYLCAPTRQAAVESPYLEAFERAGLEVIFVFTAIEDFVMANLEKYEGRRLVSVEQGDIDLSDFLPEDEQGDDKGKDESDSGASSDDKSSKLSTEEGLEFCHWFKQTLGDKKIDTCKATQRLTSSPAIVTDCESGSIRRMMRLIDTSDGNRDYVPLPKQHVEINTSHPIIVGMNKLRETEPRLAHSLAEQVYDNCLVAAGLLDDSRSMLPRLNDILLCVVNGATQNDAPAPKLESLMGDEEATENDSSTDVNGDDAVNSQSTDSSSDEDSSGSDEDSSSSDDEDEPAPKKKGSEANET